MGLPLDKKSLLSVFFIAILIGGLILAYAMRFGTVQASADVSGIPKPSVPEFTLKYLDYSYDVPPTYGIDQYTGENVTVKYGYHVDNRSIEFTFKNQPFAPYTDSSGTTLNYIIILGLGEIMAMRGLTTLRIPTGNPSFITAGEYYLMIPKCTPRFIPLQILITQ